MRIEYTGRQTEVPAAVRKLADRRIQKLSRILGGITTAHVILTVDKHRQGAEVSVHSSHMDLSATQVTRDLAASVSTALDKLERQAAHHLGRLRNRKRKGARPGAAAAARRPPEPRIIRSRRGALKPMTVDEAILEVGDSTEGLIVFRDAETERVTVLFRRKDGNLGLIEPEA